jgi:hypothetical protein
MSDSAAFAHSVTDHIAALSLFGQIEISFPVAASGLIVTFSFYLA